jgi:hypothetical protein
VQFNELVIAIVGVATSGSVLKKYIDYKQKALEAKVLKQAAPDAALKQEIAELKHKMTELRDVTTQYDMSFDTALHRVESRLANVEQRLHLADAEPDRAQSVQQLNR